jgi:hypothetical protein
MQLLNHISVLTQAMPRIPQQRNVHQLATRLASTLTAHCPTCARVVRDIAWPLTALTQRVFLCVKVDAQTGNVPLPGSVHATPVTPETLPTELGTRAFLHVLEVVSTVTALPPTSAPATTGMPNILKVTDVPHTAPQVA